MKTVVERLDFAEKNPAQHYQKIWFVRNASTISLFDHHCRSLRFSVDGRNDDVGVGRDTCDAVQFGAVVYKRQTSARREQLLQDSMCSGLRGALGSQRVQLRRDD